MTSTHTPDTPPGAPPGKPPGARTRAVWSPWTHKPTEIAIIGLWFWTTIVPFRGDTALLFALSGYVLVGCYVHRSAVLAVAQSSWILLLYPAWGLLSMLWTTAPASTNKIGLELLLSVVICFYIAARIDRRNFILAVFCGAAFYAVVSYKTLLVPSFYGPFGEKNLLASRMTVLAMTAIALFLDQGSSRIIRWAALPFAFLAMLYIRNSATALVTAFAGIAFMFALVVVWRQARGLRVLIISLTIAAVAGAALLLVSSGNGDLKEALFSALGKDSSLTGRTELWEYAREMIARKPWLGLGLGGFWRPEVLEAQTILDLYYKDRGTVFSFHNSYLEISVQLGYIGLALGVSGMAFCAWSAFRRVLQDSGAIYAFFMTIIVIAIIRCNVESDMWRQFEQMQMLVWMGGVYAASELRQIGARPSLRFWRAS